MTQMRHKHSPIPPSHGGKKILKIKSKYFHPVRSRGPNLSLFSRCCNRPGRQHLFPFKNQLTHPFSSRQHLELEVAKRRTVTKRVTRSDCHQEVRKERESEGTIALCHRRFEFISLGHLSSLRLHITHTG